MKHLNYLITIIILSTSGLALPTWADTQTPMLIITQDSQELCSAPLDDEIKLANCPTVTRFGKLNFKITPTPSNKVGCGNCLNVYIGLYLNGGGELSRIQRIELARDKCRPVC